MVRFASLVKVVCLDVPLHLPFTSMDQTDANFWAGLDLIISVCLGRACSCLMAGRVSTPLRLLASSGSGIASKVDIASQLTSRHGL